MRHVRPMLVALAVLGLGNFSGRAQACECGTAEDPTHPYKPVHWQDLVKAYVTGDELNNIISTTVSSWKSGGEVVQAVPRGRSGERGTASWESPKRT